MIIRAFAVSLALAVAFLAGTLVPSAETQTGKRQFLRVHHTKKPVFRRR